MQLFYLVIQKSTWENIYLHIQKYPGTRTLIIALIILAKYWEQPKRPIVKDHNRKS